MVLSESQNAYIFHQYNPIREWSISMDGVKCIEMATLLCAPFGGERFCVPVPLGQESFMSSLDMWL